METPNNSPKVQYTDLNNKQFPIEKFLFQLEETYEDIKEQFKCSDDVMAKAIEYDIKKDDKVLLELQEMIKTEQEQNKRDAELLTLTEKKS